jgi:hypothetical protein
LSPNGWTDCQLTKDWFESVFVPNSLINKITDDPVALWMDGHNSHETDEIKQVGYDHDIIVIALPSNTTHKTQPLDVAIFGPVQHRWSDHCDRRLMEGIKIDRYNVIHEYMTVRSVITPKIIKSAFQATGIYPLNPNVFTNDNFAPSQSFSTLAHVPSSYPTDIPTSPIAIPTDSETSETGSDDEMASDNAKGDAYSALKNAGDGDGESSDESSYVGSDTSGTVPSPEVKRKDSVYYTLDSSGSIVYIYCTGYFRVKTGLNGCGQHV